MVLRIITQHPESYLFIYFFVLNWRVREKSCEVDNVIKFPEIKAAADQKDSSLSVVHIAVLKCHCAKWL